MKAKFGMLIGTALLIPALLALTAGDGWSQKLNSSRFKRTPGNDGEVTRKASSYDPARLRNQLLAIHGTSRAALEGSSTDVESLLRGFITDPGESITVKRQAIKALGLYPSQENLTFIETGIASAPSGLQVLYMGSLRAYAFQFEGAVGSIAVGGLSSESVVVRHAAISLASGLAGRTEVRQALESRLASESDGSVRKSITRALNR